MSTLSKRLLALEQAVGAEQKSALPLEVEQALRAGLDAVGDSDHIVAMAQRIRSGICTDDDRARMAKVPLLPPPIETAEKFVLFCAEIFDQF